MTKNPSKKVAAVARKIAPMREKPMPVGVKGREGNCACDNLDMVMNADMLATPSTQYAKQELRLPLTDDEIDLFFGDTVNPLSPTSGVGPVGRITSFVDSDTTPCDLYVKGMGLYLKVENFAFEMTGNAYDTPDAAEDTPALTDTPAFSADGTTRPAVMKWGSDAWRAVAAFLEAYDFEFWVGCKYQLIGEHLADIGYVSAGDGLQGSGNMLVAAHEWIRLVNDRSRVIEKGQIFIPATVDENDNPLPPPLVTAIWGGPEFNGCYQGIYPLKQALVLPRGMPIRAQFRRTINEVMYYERLIQAVSDQGSVTYDENLNATIDGDLGYANAVMFKGGQFTYGIIFKAWEITPRACVEFVNDMVYSTAGVAGVSGVKAARAKAFSRQTKHQLHELYAYEGRGMVAFEQYARAGGIGLSSPPEDFVRNGT